jgi:hypothetical protein
MRNGRLWLVALGLLACLRPAHAQLLNTLFPEGVPGYSAEQGVTVQSRVRPQFDPLGFRFGSLTIQPLLSESIGYNDNIFAGADPRGGWQIATEPSVLIAAQNSGGSAGLYSSVKDVRYPTAPSQNRTDGSAFLGSTINVGRDKLTFGGGYLSQHEDRTALDALPSDRPVAFSVVNLRASYDALFDRFTLTPAIEFNRWRFNDTTILGAPVSEASRDRTTVQPGVTLRYGWMPGRDLLLVTRVLSTHYDAPAAGVPSNNSTSWQALLGVDYDDNTVWRYRLLGGVEYRASGSPAIASRTAGIAEAEIVWSPSGLDTMTGSLNRGIEDAAQTGLSSYTYTSAQLRIDHEYLRNLLLDATATIRQASFNQTGGQQLGIAFGAGASWLINRSLRLSMSYDFSDVRNAHLPAGTVAGDFTRNLTLLTLRIGM